MWCRQQSRNRPVPGEDRTYSLQVDFLDAVFGSSTEIDVRLLHPRLNAGQAP